MSCLSIPALFLLMIKHSFLQWPSQLRRVSQTGAEIRVLEENTHHFYYFIVIQV